MQITERFEGPILILSVAGRLDNTSSDLFREKALHHIREGTRSVIVDFAQTSYIASMGIRALFIPTKELVSLNGRIVLAGLNKDLRNLLLTAGLLDLFEVFEDAAAALTAPGWKGAAL